MSRDWFVQQFRRYGDKAVRAAGVLFDALSREHGESPSRTVCGPYQCDKGWQIDVVYESDRLRGSVLCKSDAVDGHWTTGRICYFV